MATPTTLPAAFVAGDVLEALQLNDLRGAFRVLQVVSTAKTDAFTTTSTSFTDITGLTVSITPQSTTSKIYVMASVSTGANTAANQTFLQLARGGTAIFVGDAAGSRTRASLFAVPLSANFTSSETMLFVDSPTTTSATTYSVQIRCTAAGTATVNRGFGDTDVSTIARTASSITVFEVSA